MLHSEVENHFITPFMTPKIRNHIKKNNFEIFNSPISNNDHFSEDDSSTSSHCLLIPMDKRANSEQGTSQESTVEGADGAEGVTTDSDAAGIVKIGRSLLSAQTPNRRKKMFSYQQLSA